MFILCFIFFYAYTKLLSLFLLLFSLCSALYTYFYSSFPYSLSFECGFWLLNIFFFIFVSKILLQNNCSIVCSFRPHRGNESSSFYYFMYKLLENTHEWVLNRKKPVTDLVERCWTFLLLIFIDSCSTSTINILTKLKDFLLKKNLKDRVF